MHSSPRIRTTDEANGIMPRNGLGNEKLGPGEADVYPLRDSRPKSLIGDQVERRRFRRAAVWLSGIINVWFAYTKTTRLDTGGTVRDVQG